MPTSPQTPLPRQHQHPLPRLFSTQNHLPVCSLPKLRTFFPGLSRAVATLAPPMRDGREFSAGTPEAVVSSERTRRDGPGARGPCASSPALPLPALAPAGEVLAQGLVQERLLQPRLSHRESILRDRHRVMGKEWSNEDEGFPSRWTSSLTRSIGGKERSLEVNSIPSCQCHQPHPINQPAQKICTNTSSVT